MTKAVEAADATEAADASGEAGARSQPSEPLDMDLLEQGAGADAAVAELQRAAGALTVGCPSLTCACGRSSGGAPGLSSSPAGLGECRQRVTWVAFPIAGLLSLPDILEHYSTLEVRREGISKALCRVVATGRGLPGLQGLVGERDPSGRPPRAGDDRDSPQADAAAAQLGTPSLLSRAPRAAGALL